MVVLYVVHTQTATASGNGARVLLSLATRPSGWYRYDQTLLLLLLLVLLLLLGLERAAVVVVVDAVGAVPKPVCLVLAGGFA